MLDPQLSVALIGIVASVITSILGQVAGYLLILRWIIRRQVDGNWVLRVDHDKVIADLKETHSRELTDKDNQIVAERELTKEWRGAYSEEAKAGRLKDDTLNKSIAANKINDHFYTTFMPKVPTMGDNEQREEATA